MAQNWPSKQNKADYYQSSDRCERVLRNVNFCKKSVRANMFCNGVCVNWYWFPSFLKIKNIHKHVPILSISTFSFRVWRLKRRRWARFQWCCGPRSGWDWLTRTTPGTACRPRASWPSMQKPSVLPAYCHPQNSQLHN